MPLVVKCPKCGKELSAPDELVGKLAACPQCSTRFPVVPHSSSAGPPANGPPANGPPQTAGPAGNSPDSQAGGLPATSPPATAPPATAPPTAGGPSGQRQGTARFKTAAGPPPGPSSGGALPRQPRSAAATVPTAAPVKRSAAATGQATVSVPAATPTKTPRPTGAAAGVAPATPNRAVKTAVFITSNPTDTRIDLGEDGQLPELVLHDEQKHESEDDASEQSNPIVLIAVLVISFAASAGMLFIDTSSVQSESQSKAQARNSLKNFVRPDGPLEPYQEFLREALQAHNRGEEALEKRLYRRVLNMLHIENKSEHRGLTGQAKRAAEGTTSDEELEELLSVLISDD